MNYKLMYELSCIHVVLLLFRRVHITRATLNELGNKFEVEEGNGGERDEVLAKHNVETFLIIPPSRKKGSAQGVICYITICSQTE